ncbi:MAG: hypothetical protein JSR17_03600 [Proteobacteria bacterium]|nr:hypothetical protein [Pseudomonadota bacterium]
MANLGPKFNEAAEQLKEEKERIEKQETMDTQEQEAFLAAQRKGRRDAIVFSEMSPEQQISFIEKFRAKDENDTDKSYQEKSSNTY